MEASVGQGGATLRFVGPGERPLREGLTPRRVVSILFDGDVDSWRGRWDRTAGVTPDREAVVVAGDPVRSAAADRPAETLFVPERSLAYTLLNDPDGIEPVIAAFEEYLEGVTDVAPTVFIDDVTAMDVGPADRIAFVDAVRRATKRVGGSVVVGCSPDRVTGGAIDRLTELSDTVRLADSTLIEGVERLRREDPTTFGYARRHWAEAREGIEACERNYPQSKQVHACLMDPETTPRTLGATLTGLVRLGLLDTWGKTVGPTRYDLTAYDPAGLVAIGVAFAVVTERVRLEEPIGRNEL